MEAGYKQITHGTYNMHKIINITIKAFAAMLMLAAAASCVFEKENPSGTDQQKYKYVLVQLGVNTDRMTATKADGDVVNASDADGNDVETAIKDLRVYAYTNDGENGAKVLRGYFHAQDVDTAATATKPLLMDIKVPFEEYGDTKQVYFMAVANAGGMTGTDGIIINSIGRDPQTGALVLPETFGFGEFASIRYSVADQTFQNGMPMYCQTSAAVEVNLGAEGTPNTEPGHNGHTKLPVKVTLDMTRSLSKIEVYAAEDAGAGTSSEKETDITITGVTIYNAVKDGLLFGGTLEDPDTEASVSLFETGQTVEVAHAVAEADATTGTYTPVAGPYYLAENNVESTYGFGMIEDGESLDTDGGETFLKIDYKVGDTPYSGYVQMPTINRNTWYKVLARITAGGQMNLTFVAQPWDVIEETLSYSDNVTVSESGRIKWSAQPNSNAEIVTLGADIRCEFEIATPSGAMWHASFIPVSGDVNAFGFASANTSGSVVTSPFAEGKVGDKATLTIRPLGTNLTQNNVAILRIVVKTTDGRTIAVVKNDVLSGNSSYTNKEYTITHSM